MKQFARVGVRWATGLIIAGMLSDIATAAPTIQWVRTYNGAANGSDYPYAVAVLPNGTVIGAGSENVAGQADNWLIRAYDPTGALLWTRTHNAPANGGDAAFYVAADVSGNFLVTGFETRTDLGQGLNWLVRKFDVSGNVLWSRTHNGPINSDDFGWRVAFDDSGNSCGCGPTVVGAGNQDALLTKWDSSGDVQWQSVFAGAAGSTDGCGGIAFDSAGNILYGINDFPSAGDYTNWRIQKLTSSGSVTWSRTHGITAVAGSDDRLNGIRSDSAGNVIAMGFETRTDLGQSVNWRVIKYDPSGGILWQQSYNSPANGYDEPFDMEITPDDGIVIAGYETRTDLGESHNWRVIKYDSAGTLLWSLTHDGVAGGSDEAHGIAVGPGGEIYVIGIESVAGQGNNWLLWKVADTVPPAISVAATALPAAPVAGGSMSLIFSVSNAGMDTVLALSIVDTLPAGYVMTAQAADPGLTWNGSLVLPAWFGSVAVAPGGVVSVTVYGSVATCAATLATTVWAGASNGSGSVQAGRALTVPVTVPASGIAAVLAQNPASPVSGGPVDYLLVVTNTGAATLTTVTVTATLPAMIAVTGSEQPVGVPAPVVTGTASGTQYVWSAAGPTLAPGASWSFTLSGAMGVPCAATAGAVGAYVTAGSACGATALQSNAVAYALPGLPAAALGLAMQRNPSAPTAGGAVTYTLIVTNTSAASLQNVLVVATLPAGLVFTGQSATTGMTWNGQTAVVGWSRTTGFAPGESATMMLQAQVTAGFTGAIQLRANAASAWTCGLVEAAAVSTFLIESHEPAGEGEVRIVGGIRGYINPRMGERATILVRPRSAGRITVRIYDLSGYLVKVIAVDAAGGRTEVLGWDGTDDAGHTVDAGVYPILVEAPGIVYRDSLAVMR